MKRLLLLLCVLAMLLTMTFFVGCTDDEEGNPDGNNPQTEQGKEDGGNSDDEVVNKDNTQNDDTAADIFDKDPHVSDNLQ